MFVVLLTLQEYDAERRAVVYLYVAHGPFAKESQADDYRDAIVRADQLSDDHIAAAIVAPLVHP